MKRTKRQLKLNRETIRALTGDLHDVVGGVEPKSTVAPNCACWPDPMPAIRLIATLALVIGLSAIASGCAVDDTAPPRTGASQQTLICDPCDPNDPTSDDDSALSWAATEAALYSSEVGAGGVGRCSSSGNGYATCDVIGTNVQCYGYVSGGRLIASGCMM